MPVRVRVWVRVRRVAPAAASRFFSAPADETMMGWPHTMVPLSISALAAPCSSAISTYATPWHLPERSSLISRTSTTLPAFEKAWKTSNSPVFGCSCRTISVRSSLAASAGRFSVSS